MKDVDEKLFNDIFNDKADFFLVDEQIILSNKSVSEEDIKNCKKVFIDGEHSRTKLDFMEEVYHKLNFPSYFGRNWDAFMDSFQERLCDDELLFEKYMLIFENSDLLLSQASEDDVQTLIEMIRQSIDVMADPVSKMKIKIIFCLKDPTSSRFGQEIVNQNILGRVIRKNDLI